jgi:pimeloyl-ACP methyl ester carboxylesterase
VCADAIQNVEYEFPQQAVDQMLAAFSADFAGTIRQMVGSMFPPTADTGLVAWVAARGAAADTAAVLALVRDFPNFDLRRALTEAKVPVRCVNAAPRPPAGPVTTVDINRKYGDFDAVLMDSVGHYLMLERPAEFNAKARAFVEGLTGTAEGGR